MFPRSVAFKAEGKLLSYLHVKNGKSCDWSTLRKLTPLFGAISDIKRELLMLGVRLSHLVYFHLIP